MNTSNRLPLPYMKRKLAKTLFFIVIGVISGCGSLGADFNVFSLEDDKTLGRQVVAEIESDSSKMILLDSVEYHKVYTYLYSIRDSLLNSGVVKYKDDFPWRIRIIHDDSMLNAFCAPGGYIYLFTGLLKFLESEDQLAGVLGHEMGHADLRHSTRQLTKMYGVQTLLSLIAGDRALIKDITGAIIGLSFSRSHEKEADDCSVAYLCPTHYNADAGAEFFAKLSQEGGKNPPEILSTHPDPGNRIEAYRQKKQLLGCTGNNRNQGSYQLMIKMLP
jgi:predicted Zn-dependent protease